MADDRPMAEQLQAPTGGFESAIVVPHINAQNFELKSSLNFNPLFKIEFFEEVMNEEPHAHIRHLRCITNNQRYPDVPNTTIKHLTLFHFSAGRDDEEIISIKVSRQISPKVNSEPSIESPISSSPSISSSEASEYSLDEFDNDDDLFEMDSNNDEWKRILYGEGILREMDSYSDKTKGFMTNQVQKF
ncbi:hypothetical protein Tco_0906006 [Tanacetum coccineum]